MMAQVELDRQKFTPRCIKHESDILPLYCRDCNRLMCSDCVTTDHVGHNLCKVSEVAEFHQNELKTILKSSESKFVLEKFLQQLQEKQINIAKDSENLINRVLEREEEIIQRVKLWRRKLIRNIYASRKRCGLSLKHNENVINALLHFEELSTEIDTINIVATYLNCEVKRLYPSKMEYNEDKTGSVEYTFEVGTSGEDLDTSFGMLKYYSEQESSSDAVIEDNENIDDSEDESNFYECYENKVSHIYQTCAQYCIDDIVVFNERRIFILSRGTLFHSEATLNDNKIAQRIIKEGVHQMAEISSTEDLLYLLEDKKEIGRISKRNTITKFMFTKVEEDEFCALNSGGYLAYACLMLRRRVWRSLVQYDHYICLLNEYGVTLKKYSYLLGGDYILNRANWRLMLDVNKYITLCTLRPLEKTTQYQTRKLPLTLAQLE